MFRLIKFDGGWNKYIYIWNIGKGKTVWMLRRSVFDNRVSGSEDGQDGRNWTLRTRRTFPRTGEFNLAERDVEFGTRGSKLVVNCRHEWNSCIKQVSVSKRVERSGGDAKRRGRWARDSAYRSINGRPQHRPPFLSKDWTVETGKN